MVDASPGQPGDAGTLAAYRGDPWAQTFQFVDADTTDWVINAQARRYADDDTIAATFDIDTNFQGDPTLVNVSLDETAAATLPKGQLPCDLEVVSGAGITEKRTMLAWLLDVDADVTRIEGS